MVFTKTMDFKFEPIKIGYYSSFSKAISYTIDNRNLFIVLNAYQGADKHPVILSIYNPDCSKVAERKFPYSYNEWHNASLYFDGNENHGYFYLIKINNIVQKYDNKLNLVDTKQLPPIQGTEYALFDLDGDGNDELIFVSKDLNNLILSRNDFSNFTIAHCPGAGDIDHFSLKIDNSNKRELFAQFKNISYMISYGPNALYYLEYPLYGGIYLCIFGFIILIQKTQKHRTEQKYKTEKQIAELQLKSIKNQIDPHFTFNIINSIGSLFHKQDIDKADYIFGKYSKMLRLTILSSDKIFTTLSEELDYVRTYIELEQFRQDNKFDWEFNIDKNVNLNLNIPKMLIHTFVENSIKHGLRHIEKDGLLSILVTSEIEEYSIKITDNGIGRIVSQQLLRNNTGKGLQILDQILDLYYDLKKVRITYIIKDIL